MSDDYFEDTPLLWKLKRKISNLIEPVLLSEDINNPLYADIVKQEYLYKATSTYSLYITLPYLQQFQVGEKVNVIHKTMLFHCCIKQ